jgi:hypothetical protein
MCILHCWLKKINYVQDARYVHKNENIVLQHKRHFMENKTKIMLNALKIQLISLLIKHIQNESHGVFFTCVRFGKHKSFKG